METIMCLNALKLWKNVYKEKHFESTIWGHYCHIHHFPLGIKLLWVHFYSLTIPFKHFGFQRNRPLIWDSALKTPILFASSSMYCMYAF